MKNYLDEISAVSQALDYLSEQPFSAKERKIILSYFEKQDFKVDLKTLNNQFPDKKGVATRLHVIFTFAKKNKKDTEMLEDLKAEISLLISEYLDKKKNNYDL